MKRVKKVWGEELWIVNRREYCGKILRLKWGYQSSLHYHKKKDETFYVNRGKILMEVAKKKRIMKQGNSIHIKPSTIHRFTGLSDTEIFEFSTHHEDQDTFRITKSQKAFLKKAYDYDGVVSEGLKLEKFAPIITGRSFEEVDKIKIKGHAIYFNPISYFKKSDRNSVRWKAEIINKLEVGEFYEDNSYQVEFLKKLCPHCNIVLWTKP